MGNSFIQGRKGEEIAARYLKKRGYSILERNYRSCGAEIDIVARKDDYLCFVEVKTRQSDTHGLPEEFVDRRKMHKILRGARLYASKKIFQNLFKRFDVISIVSNGSEIRIEHFDNAFEEPFDPT